MRALLLTGIRQMQMQDVPKPTLQKDTDVLLKIEKVGVCGSDVHYYETGRIGSQVVEYPFIVGHECSATVEAVGSKVERVKVGQQVVVEPAVSCHECDQCRQGRENTCFNLRFLGTPGQGNGCLCEYIVMPQENCFPINGTLTLEQGVLCEPFTIAVYSVKQSAAWLTPSQIFNPATALVRAKPAVARRSAATRNAKIAVLGSGPIGLSCMAAAKAEGIESIYMTDKLDYRVQIAQENGAVWAGSPQREDIVKAILKQEPLGMDIAYECAGQQETLDEAVELLKPGGRLMLIGIPRLERVSFLIDKIRRKELTLINIRRQNKCTQTAIDLIASGRAKVDFMITHRFELERAQEAFDMVAGYHDGVVKALVEL